jgi:hypothetical protein
VYIQKIHVQHNGDRKKWATAAGTAGNLRPTSPHLLAEIRILEETVEIAQFGHIIDVRVREYL